MESEAKRNSSCTKRLSKCTMLIEYPSPTGNSVRRLPRLCSTPAEVNNGVESETCMKVRSLEVVEKSMRRSPRIMSSAQGNVYGGESEKCLAICPSPSNLKSEKCVRRSPRTSVTPADIESGKSSGRLSSEVNLVAEMVLRRSPRMHLTSAGEVSEESEKCLVRYQSKAQPTSAVVVRRSPRMHLIPEDRDYGEPEKCLVRHTSQTSSRRSSRLNSIPADCNDAESGKCLLMSSSRSNSTSEKRVRRSPRLSLSPADVNRAGSEKGSRKRSSLSNLPLRRSPRTSSNRMEVDVADSDALALTLHVLSSGIGYGEEEDHPVPLMIYDPNLPSEKSVRRSPRFSEEEFVRESASQRSIVGEELNRSSFRRSPRLSQSQADTAGTLDSQQRPAKEAPGRCLRRSPRLSPSPAEIAGKNNLDFSRSLVPREGFPAQNYSRRSPRLSPEPSCLQIEWPVSSGKRGRRVMKGEQEDPKSKKFKTSLEEKCLRKSPRFSLYSASSENGNSHCENLALPSPQKGKVDLSVSEKTLRSRTIEFRVCKKEETEVKSGLIVIPDENIKTLENIDLDKLNAKRSRYGKIQGAFPAPHKKTVEPSLTEKHLRSPTMELRLCKKEEIEVKSVSTETPHKNIKTVGNIDSDKLSEKCLRSGKIRVATVGPEVTKLHVSGHKSSPATESETCAFSCKKHMKLKRESFFVGEPVPEDEARERWGWRYDLKGQRREGQSWILNAGEEDEVHLNVDRHYLQANVDGCIFNLGDCAKIKGEGKQEHVGRILEFFRTSKDESYFRVQWFFRAEDTVMKEAATFHDKKRLFFSTLMNDNLLECIVSKVNVIEITPALDLQSNSIQPSEYYYDMEYSVKYSTFRTLLTAPDDLVAKCDFSTPNVLNTHNMALTMTPSDLSGCCQPYKAELALLDLYAGCGGMSTGLCLGAKLSGVSLVTRWAIDYHKSACDSLKLNHPETQVRHTTAEDFLELLREWEKLCKSYVINESGRMFETSSEGTTESKSNESSLSDANGNGEFEVSCLVDICYGDPSRTGQHGLKFKVRWKGYGPSEDTWEPIEGLSNCQGHIQDFVRSGYESKVLPVPGDVDVICGGPPCQGISGYNRFRNTDDPLTDERNQQIVVFFDIVKFLKPKYVLMENVADILRFDKASLGRYALSRLVHMNYQARVGIMAAGSYGLPQFRLRVFIWGAIPSEKLPQFPLPTHEVIVRYYPPAEFEQNTVAYDEGQPRELQEAVVLRDAISDLPAVTSHENREEMTYQMPPETEFQKYIRLTKDEITGSVSKGVTDWRSSVLYDHRPYQLSEDNYLRVCHIPHRKGANFRDFPGIAVSSDNVVYRDPKMEPVLLPSGKPIIPDYVFTFEKGKSKRPFARVWWDETVATVVTFPNLRNQAAIHPEQDRVLTLREYARLQGFPDHYRFCGNVKERYCQVGNAVAVPVAKTLGYALGMAFRKLSGDEPLMTLPSDFAFQVPPVVDIVIS